MEIIEILPLGRNNLKCLKLDKSIRYIHSIYPKIKSLLAVNKIKVLLESAVSDKNFRDFLCVNIQEVASKVYEKNKKYIEAIDYEEDMFLFRKFGFINDELNKEKEEEYIFLKNLTNAFASKIEFLKGKNLIQFSSYKIKGFEDLVKIPFKTFLEGIGKKDFSIIGDNIFADINGKEIQDYFLAWQNKTIFEKLIALIIERELGCKVHCSKYISIDDKDPMKNSLEFDNIFVYDNKICFIELKNGNIKRNSVFEFIGKVKAVESYYEFKADKIAILGTGQKDPIFENLTKKIQNFGVFDIEDYRKDFSSFFDFIKK